VLAIEKTVAFDLRGSWQVRALAEARGHTGMVLMSVLAHTYDEAMAVILPLAVPGFTEPSLPCLVSAAKVAKSGAVIADVIDRMGRRVKDAVVYRTETALRDDFRRLADRLKLNDPDRVELFKCVQRWVVADRRLDPTFDPQDPDAKRLIH
jgi:hypothetical protein